MRLDPRFIAMARARREGAYAQMAHSERQPSKAELRAQIDAALRNTAPAAGPTSPVALAHGKTRSEQGGSSA